MSAADITFIDLHNKNPKPCAHQSCDKKTAGTALMRLCSPCEIHPTGKSVAATKTRPAPFQKIFRFLCRANQFYQLAPSFPGKRGASRSSRTRDGMRWTRQRWRANGVAGQALLVSDRPARRRTALQRLGQNSTGSTWSVETLVEVAAYGEVVWSWHPLLMLSLRRCVGPTGLRQILIRRRR